ncbi:hypothetical protein NXC24_PC02098 (plasmid) [Rhizobium sp. NXC24]|nr:hypothetical protein NXC24_PC02098 [Rhizobium sp. NXC24]
MKPSTVGVVLRRLSRARLTLEISASGNAAWSFGQEIIRRLARHAREGGGLVLGNPSGI